MSKKCLVTYINSVGRVVSNEPNLLIENDDQVFALGRNTGMEPWQFERPGCVLLEDDQGLWSLERSDLIELTIIEKET